MNVLSIGSDRSLFNRESEARKRITEYSELFESLQIVVFSKRKSGFKITVLSELLSLYPTNSLAKIFYVSDAIKIGTKIIKNGAGKNWVITAQDPFESGLVAYILGKRFSVPVQIQIHTDFLSTYFLKESFLNRFRVFIAKIILPRADGIRVVSERIKKSLIEKLNIPESKITILPIFVDTEKIKNAPIVTDLHKKYPNYDKIILMASRLTREKNIPLALEAMREIVKKFPKTLLLIVGEGPETENLKSQISNFKLGNNVILEPWTDDLSSYYKTADLFLLTSNYEGYGRTLAEAIICDCKVVTSDVGLVGEPIFRKTYLDVFQIGQSVELVEILDKTLSGAFSDHNKKRDIGEIHFIDRDKYLKNYKQSLELSGNQTCSKNNGKTVVFAINDLDYGGGQTTVINQANILFLRGYNVHVFITLSKKNHNLIVALKIPNHNLHYIGFKSFFDLGAYRRLFLILKRINPQVILSNLFFTNLVIRSVKLFFPKIRVIVREGNIPVEKSLFVKIFDYLASLLTYKIIVNAEVIKQCLVKGLKIKENKIITIYNGIDDVFFKNKEILSRSHIGFSMEDFVIIAVGSMSSHKKGFDFLIDAMRIVVDIKPIKVKLVLIGEGSNRTALEKKVKDLGLSDNIYFVGNRNNIENWFDESDLFVLSSLWEGMPNVMLEAMACGLPVIASKVGGVEEMISDGENGVLVPPGNSKALANAIIKIIDNYDQARIFGDLARKTVLDLKWSNHVDKIEKIICAE